MINKLITVAILLATLPFLASAQTTYVIDFTSDGNTTTTNITETETSVSTSESSPSPTTSTIKSSYSDPVETPSQDKTLNETPEPNTTFQSVDETQVESQVTTNETVPSEQEPTSTLPLTYSAPLILLFLLLIARKKA